MPRIESLKQNTLMQVSNPTGYASVSEAGIAGDGLAKMGQQIDRAAGVVLDVYKSAQEDKRKLEWDDHKVNAEVDSATARSYAELKSADPLGGDKRKLFEDKYAEITKQRLDQVPDDSMKKSVDSLYKDRGAKQVIEILQHAPSDAVKGMDEVRKQNTQSTLAAIGNDIMTTSGQDYQNKKLSFMDKIKEKETLFDSMSNTYTPKQIQQLKSDFRDDASTIAINSLINKKDFKGARQAIAMSAQYLDIKDRAKFDDKVTDEYYKNINQQHTLLDVVDKNAAQVMKKKNASDFIQGRKDLLAMAPEERQAHIAVLRASGMPDKSVDDLSEVVGLPKVVKNRFSLSPGVTLVNERIKQVLNGEDITNLVAQDEKSGQYSHSTASLILNSQLFSSSLDNEKKPMQKEKFKEATQTLNNNFKHVDEVDAVEGMQKHLQNVTTGMDPHESAAKVSNEIGKRQEQKLKTSTNDAYVLSILHQPDIKGLHAMESDIKLKLRSKNKNEQNQIMKAYTQKMNALKMQGGTK